jgi:hypothetical protein
MESEYEPTYMTPQSKLFSKLFESRQMAHVYHLSVKGDMGSYAKHISLGQYYKDILKIIDELIETYQGQYDLVNDYETIDTIDTRSKDPLVYFEELAKFIKDNRYRTFREDDTHLHNIIDGAVALIYRTIYKLKFNR